MKREKIIYLITKGNWGGAQRYVFDLATALPKEKYEVVVACGAGGLLTKKLAAAGIRTVSIPSLERNLSVVKDIRALAEMYRLLRKERPEVVHLNSPKAAGLGALAALWYLLTTKNAEIKTVQTVHGFTFNEDRPFRQRAAIAFFSWLTMLLCHATIVLSAQEYAQAARFPFVKRACTLIPLGIHPLVFLTREEARKKLNLPPESFVIGSIGELTPNKDYGRLIFAAIDVAKTHPLRLALIGDGEDRAEILDIARSALTEGIGGQNILYGFKEDAAQYLKAFDIFVLPSKKEGFPYVLVESGLASIPVIATSVGGVPEIVEHAASGLLVPPKDQQALAEALRALLENEAARRRYGEALNRRVSSLFPFEAMLAKTEALYRAGRVIRR